MRVRRPSDYNPSMAATLGPSQPSPHLNLAAVGLTPGYVRHPQIRVVLVVSLVFSAQSLARESFAYDVMF